MIIQLTERNKKIKLPAKAATLVLEKITFNQEIPIGILVSIKFITTLKSNNLGDPASGTGQIPCEEDMFSLVKNIVPLTNHVIVLDKVLNLTMCIEQHNANNPVKHLPRFTGKLECHFIKK